MGSIKRTVEKEMKDGFRQKTVDASIEWKKMKTKQVKIEGNVSNLKASEENFFKAGKLNRWRRE